MEKSVNMGGHACLHTRMAIVARASGNGMPEWLVFNTYTFLGSVLGVADNCCENPNKMCFPGVNVSRSWGRVEVLNIFFSGCQTSGEITLESSLGSQLGWGNTVTTESPVLKGCVYALSPKIGARLSIHPYLAPWRKHPGGTESFEPLPKQWFAFLRYSWLSTHPEYFPQTISSKTKQASSWLTMNQGVHKDQCS